MDTSKKYIEMCERAEKIQKEWKPDNGDFYMYKPTGNQSIISLENQLFETEHDVWLPRQDQLQEMLSDNFDSIHDMFGEFTCWIYDLQTTAEQLWLAFVMSEKYNKVWSTTKKDWVAQQAE